jgi:probable HAF family extracellular repeat protein
MKLSSARLLVAAGVSAVIAAVLPSSAVSSTRDVPAKACGSGGVRAVIDGKPACLWVGLHCNRRFDAQYRRYAFACPNGGLTIVSRWQIRDLGTLPGFPSSAAAAINERGEVVGVSAKTDGGEKAGTRVFLWRDGRMQDITAAPWPAHVRSLAINDAGQVLEAVTTATGEEHAFEWENGVSTDLGTLGGTYTHAAAMNARGQIVGWSEISPVYPGYTVHHAFLWEHGVMLDLGTLGGEWSVATSINARGQIVGGAYNATRLELTDNHAVLWEDGVIHDLGTFGGNSRADAINDQGLIVGTSFEGFGMSSYTRAIYWSDGVVNDFGVGAFPQLLNNRGQVVLSQLGHPDEAYHYFLWSDGSYRELNCFFGVSALNDRGQILCTHRDRHVSPRPEAVILEKGRAWNLASFGVRGTYASALNERDQIVGAAATDKHHLHAVIWTRRPHPRP